MRDFNELLENCEDEIRAGRGHLVGKRLAELSLPRVPRELRLRFANVCRRAGLITLAIKLLARIVHPTRGKLAVAATSAELAEYAMLLQRTGATKEAMQLLARVDVASVPEALLYRALCHFSLWQDREAIPLLEAYLRAPLPDYWRVVGRVNLASAYIATLQFDAALALLESNIAEARGAEYTRILGNCLELRAQIRFKTNDFASARLDLESARSLFQSLQTPDQLYVSKWLAFMDGAEASSTEPILRFRGEARARGDWESVRESDRQLLKLDFESERFAHLLFGTPFVAYREFVCAELGRRPESPSYRLGKSGARCLDLASGEIDGSEALNPGKLSHRLIEILLRDFYRPLRLGALFAELFPGDHFDIFSSPDRVHQVLRRARRQLDALAVPARIVERAGNYSLELLDTFAVLVPYERVEIGGASVDFERLKARFGEARFSAREAREALGIPRTSFQRLVDWAVERDALEILGEGNAIKYAVRKSAVRASDSREAA